MKFTLEKIITLLQMCQNFQKKYFPWRKSISSNFVRNYIFKIYELSNSCEIEQLIVWQMSLSGPLIHHNLHMNLSPQHSFHPCTKFHHQPFSHFFAGILSFIISHFQELFWSHIDFIHTFFNSNPFMISSIFWIFHHQPFPHFFCLYFHFHHQKYLQIFPFIYFLFKKLNYWKSLTLSLQIIVIFFLYANLKIHGMKFQCYPHQGKQFIIWTSYPPNSHRL